MTGRDMFGNKISEEQRKASLQQALGIAGAGALSTKVAGKTAKAGANAVANGAKKLSEMRNVLSKQATQRIMPPLQSAQKAYRFSSNYVKKKISQAGDIKLAPKKVRVVEEPMTGTRMPVVDEWITGKDVGRMFSVRAEGSTGVRIVDGVPRLPEVEVTFKKNPKHDTQEFARQLRDQEKGMNELTVDEYAKNRKRYLDEGRASEGNVAQQTAREEALSDKIMELMSQGKPFDTAESEARDWMSTQAALHNPDQIAGGNPLNIGGMGDFGINSSIRRQWGYRIKKVDTEIQKMIKTIPEERRKEIYLNVKLRH
jgi:hypothetical protein